MSASIDMEVPENFPARAANIAHVALDAVIADFSRPAWRAGFGAAMLTTIVMARSGVRGGLAVFVALSVGAAVEQLYAMAEDIHEKLTADG